MPHSPQGSIGAIALIVAAGRGERLGGAVPKQYLKLSGRPILALTVERFLRHPLIDAVRVVIGNEDRALYDTVMPSHPKLLPPVVGGPTRQESVRLGIESLTTLGPETVLIHDAARPLVGEDDISALVETLTDVEGAYLGSAVVDTLRRHDLPGDNSTLVDRSNLWRAQTPQGFKFQSILNAHRDAVGHDFTDDVEVAQFAGIKVKVLEGSPTNIKITKESDLEMAERLMQSTEKTVVNQRVRTGMGYDVHRFAEGNALWLCGVEIEHSQSLKGHSDADVALHALTDAILGAVGQGDIGDHFPPSDEKWKNAPSRLFVEHAATCVRDLGGQLTNVDLTLICETPKISPHKDRMRQAISEMLQIPADHVSVKATTTEGLGFTGRREGIAAQAIATVTFQDGE